MITIRESFSALYGAGRLARFEADGMAFFDVSANGAMRSFYAALIVAPFYGILLAMRFPMDRLGAGALRYTVVEIITYVVSWVAFPVIMASLAKFIEREEKYPGFIVAYNWASVLQNALYISVSVLAASGAISGEIANVLGIGVLIVVLIYSWFVATTALDLGAVTAAGVVILDLVLSVFINAFSETLLAASP